MSEILTQKLPPTSYIISLINLKYTSYNLLKQNDILIIAIHLFSTNSNLAILWYNHLHVLNNTVPYHNNTTEDENGNSS